MYAKLLPVNVLTCISLLAQKSSSEPIDRCGLGTHHNCQCSARYHAIQQKIVLYCELHSQTKAQIDTCMFLDLALGAAYTPLAIGADGKIYTENKGTLFVIGK